MNEIILVGTEKRVFESRDESKLIVQFEIFGLSQLYFHTSGNTKKTTFKSNFPSKVLIVPLKP